PPNASNIAYTWGTAGQNNGDADRPTWSWLARILPFIEQNALASAYNIPNATLSQAQAGLAAVIPTYVCPADPSSPNPATDWPNIGGISMGLTSYKGVSGSNWNYSHIAALNNVGPTGNGDGLGAGN